MNVIKIIHRNDKKLGARAYGRWQGPLVGSLDSVSVAFPHFFRKVFFLRTELRFSFERAQDGNTGLVMLSILLLSPVIKNIPLFMLKITKETRPFFK